MARQKEFDTQIVLEKAMDVFWKNGYEHTSMQNLVDAMGIHRRSIYDTFVDKHNLFILSLKLYEELIIRNIQLSILESMSVHEKLKTVFSVIVSDKDHRAGCLIVNTAAELSNIDPVVEKEIQDFFNREEHLIFNILLTAQEKNEIAASTDIEALSCFLHNALIGIRVLSKTTDDNEKLNMIIDQTLKNIN